jgi:hypothetical protein
MTTYTLKHQKLQGTNSSSLSLFLKAILSSLLFDQATAIFLIISGIWWRELLPLPGNRVVYEVLSEILPHTLSF